MTDWPMSKKCPYCPRRFWTWLGMARHLKWHDLRALREGGERP